MHIIRKAVKLLKVPLSMFLFGLLSLIVPSSTFSPGSSRGCTEHIRTLFPSKQFMSVGDSGNEETGAGEEPIVESVVRIDDGGADLTNRFKYKVNALMGVFDPQTGVDDENQSGNILNALLKFPVRYSFNVAGRTSGDDKLKDQFIDEVKDIVASLSGDGDRMEVRITPRGQSFTRVTMQVTVESVLIINSIYDALEKSDKTVMQY